MFSFFDKMFFQIVLRFHVNIIPRIPIIHSIIAFISNPLTRTLVPNIRTTSSFHYAHLPNIYHIYPNSALTPGLVYYFWLSKNPTIQHLILTPLSGHYPFAQLPGMDPITRSLIYPPNSRASTPSPGLLFIHPITEHRSIYWATNSFAQSTGHRPSLLGH
jgi:hypothetical protein